MTFDPIECLRLAAALTPRQREILIALAGDKLRKEIADDLGISQGTVDRHCYMLYRKIGVKSVVAASRFAIAGGLVRG